MDNRATTFGPGQAAFLLAIILSILAAPAVAAPAPDAKPHVAAKGEYEGPEQEAIAAAKEAMRADPAATLALAGGAYERLLRRPRSEPVIIGIAQTEWLQAEASLRLNNAEMAAPFVESALKALAPIKRPLKLRGDLLLTRGGVHTVQANVSGALSDYQTAHNIFQQLGETRSQAIALQQIASLYREADDFETAMKYDSQSAEIYKGDVGLEVSNYNNMGNYLVQNKKYAEAEAQYKLALKTARRLDSPVLEARILRNIARTELQAGKLAEADKTIALGLRLTATGEGKAWEGQMLAIQAQALLQHGNLARAADTISRTFQDVDLTETSLSYRDAHETAYKIFQQIGRPDRALPHLEALKRLDDQTAKLAASTNTALMAARFDYANQNLKIAKLRADDAMRTAAFERARARTDRFIFIGVVAASSIGVSLLIIGLLTIRRSRNEVRAANVVLNSTNVKLEKALAAKTEFLATTSHEIRTPLNGILGMTQVMLADQGLAETTRERLSVVHGAGVTMRALVDDILDVAKMETGNLTLEAVPMDLRATLSDVSKLWQEQARARGIEFVIDIDDCPQMIIGDPARLRQIVFNLLSNAMKFTSDGAVTMQAEAIGDTELRVSVSDTGIGIPADKLEQIFESFRQVDAGTTRKFGGTGLGLSICRNLARAMGGDIEVRSELGSGSTFSVTLPLTLAPSSEAPPGAQAAAPGLLIVDRNPISRSMLRALLESHAGEIAFAASADQAVAWLVDHAPRQLLIDDATIKSAPDRDAALAAIVAAARARGASVALLWPSPSDDDHAAFVALGIDKVVSKPIIGAVLVEMMYPSAPERGQGNVVTPHLVSRAA